MRKKKEVTLGVLIFTWALAIAFLLSDILYLRPNGDLTWWHVTCTVIMGIAALIETFSYVKGRKDKFYEKK